MHKRGVSDVVATVIIIALVIVAISVVWIGVIPLVKDKIGGSDVCNDVDVSIESSQGYTCWDKNQSIVAVQIHKGSNDVNVSGFKFYVSSAGNSVSYIKDIVFPKNSYSVFYLNVSGFSVVEKVEVVPVLNSGKSTKDCAKVSVGSLQNCNLGIVNAVAPKSGLCQSLLDQGACSLNSSCVWKQECGGVPVDNSCRIFDGRPEVCMGMDVCGVNPICTGGTLTGEGCDQKTSEGQCNAFNTCAWTTNPDTGLEYCGGYDIDCNSATMQECASLIDPNGNTCSVLDICGSGNNPPTPDDFFSCSNLYNFNDNPDICNSVPGCSFGYCDKK